MSTTTMSPSTPRRQADREAARTRTRQARSGHTALEIAALVVIVVLLIVGIFATAAPRARHDGYSTSQVLVERGQSLWTIAASHPVEGQTTEQTAELIADLNGFDNGVVAVGSTIKVPAVLGDRVLTASR
jgi:hypothetical protein